MQSRDNDVMPSTHVIEKWLDSNPDWLTQYLHNRKLSQRHNDACDQVITSAYDVIVPGRRMSSVTVSLSDAEATTTPASLTRTRCTSRGSQLGDSSAVRRSTSWTRKELAMSRDNGPGSASTSPGLIVLTGDCYTASPQQTSNGGSVFFPAVGCTTSGAGQHQHHQRCNSKKHLRYDFARSRAGRCVSGKLTSNGSVSGQQQQLQQQQQQQQQQLQHHNAMSTGGSGAGGAAVTSEPSFASFDG
jgi:hypothetical protein